MTASILDQIVRENQSLHTLFEETKSGRLRPRVVLGDSDPEMPLILRKYYPHAYDMIDKDYVVTGKEGSCNHYSKGKYTSRELTDLVTNKIRLQLEACDMPQGTLIHNSVLGGCGSGFFS
jgi:hypothetical protein